MSDQTAENRLAKFIHFIATREADVIDSFFILLIIQLEYDRIRLAKISAFDPFQIFRSIDKTGKGYLNQSDLASFLRSFNIIFEDREFESLFSIYKDGIRKITFQDFLRHVTPVSDIALKNSCLNRFGKHETPNDELEDVEDLIATIYQKEIEFNRQFEIEKNYLSTSLQSPNLLNQLIDEVSGCVTFQSVYKFLRRNNYDLQPNEFESLNRRIDINKKGPITFRELSSYLYPVDLNMSGNYSVSGREYYKHETQRSIFDSMSSPIQEAPVLNEKNIKINETYMPSISLGNFHSNSPQKKTEIYTAKLVSVAPEYKDVNKNNHVIINDGIVMERQNNNFSTGNIKIIEDRNHILDLSRTEIHQPSEIIMKSHIPYQESGRVIGNFYSREIATIKDHPIYHHPPQVAHVEGFRQDYTVRPAVEKVITNITPASTYVAREIHQVSPRIERRVEPIVTYERRQVSPRVERRVEPILTYERQNMTTLPKTYVNKKVVQVSPRIERKVEAFEPRINYERRNFIPTANYNNREVNKVPPLIQRKLEVNETRVNYENKDIPTRTYITTDVPKVSSNIQRKHDILEPRKNYGQKNFAYADSASRNVHINQLPLRTQVEDFELRRNIHVHSNIKNEKAVSISPIKRRLSVDTFGASKQNTYISPNLPPKYQTSLSKDEDFPSRFSRESIKEKPSLSFPSRTENISTKIQNHDFSHSKENRSEPYIQPSRPYIQTSYSKTSTRQERNQYNSDNQISGAVRQSYLAPEASREIARKEPINSSKQETTITKEVAGTSKQEDIRRSTVLESYRYDNDKPNSLHKRNKPSYDAQLKTESDQIGASSYKFANSKYEQLWNTDSNQDNNDNK